MKIRPDRESEWQLALDCNKDSRYACAIISYAQRWAEDMEEQIKAGKTVAECARGAMYRANTGNVSGSMGNDAVDLIAEFWVDGEAFAKWAAGVFRHLRGTSVA